MKPQRLRYLLNQYYKGLCTPDEEQELNGWYHNIPLDDEQFQKLLRSTGEQRLADDMYNEFKSRTGGKILLLNSRKWMMRVAAVLTGFCLLTGAYYLIRNKSTSNQIASATPASANENQFI